jgi:hypothetical protein
MTPRRRLTLLREFAPEVGVKHRVDRAKCIIYGVKVLGRKSPNKHGLAEATQGTEYTTEAMEAALHRYEGAKVNIDHPPRERPGKERSALDRSGKLLNARVTPEGIRADLKLIPSHPMTPRLLDAAEDPDLNDCFGLSHNAWGRGDVRNGRYVITEIPEVRSVDVVADAGTVTSLFESRNMAQTLKKLLEGHKTARAKKKAVLALLEEGPDGYGDMPMETGDGGEVEAEDHLCNAITAVIKDDGMSPEEKKKKVIALLKVLHDGEGEGGGKEEEVAEGDDEEEERETEECEEEQPGKKVKESKRPRRHKDPTVRSLQERLDLADLREWCREECERLQVACDKALLEGLVAMRERPKITAHLTWIKGKTVPAPAGRGGQRPVSQGQGATRPVQEQAEANGIPKDGDQQLAWLRS